MRVPAWSWLPLSLSLAASCLLAADAAPVAPPFTPPASAPATRPVGKQTIVLVHGAWAGGWEWKKVGNLLASHGHTIYRPTLTGQGERVHLASRDLTLSVHIDDIVNTILFEDLHDIVLVGHSYGGMVVTGVADRVPDRIKCLLYIDAAVPLDGEDANTTIGRLPRPANADGFLPLGNWPPPPGARPPYVVPMAANLFATPIVLRNQQTALKIPTAYILTVDPGKTPEQDMFFKSYARAKDHGWATSVMTGSHVVHVDQAANTAARIEQAILDARPGTPPAKPLD